MIQPGYAVDDRPKAVVFDVGNVLYDWQPRALYAPLIADPCALDAFLDDVVSKEWHFQHDAGRRFADTCAELTALFPQHAALIALWGPRFNDTLPGMIPGMRSIIDALHASGVPLFAITNFSDEFWGPFVKREAALFGCFRDIVVSGAERMVKPDPAIYALALTRFGLAGSDAIFVDDRPENVAGAEAAGMHGHLFEDAATLRRALEGLGLLHATG